MIALCRTFGASAAASGGQSPTSVLTSSSNSAGSRTSHRPGTAAGHHASSQPARSRRSIDGPCASISCIRRITQRAPSPSSSTRDASSRSALATTSIQSSTLATHGRASGVPNLHTYIAPPAVRSAKRTVSLHADMGSNASGMRSGWSRAASQR
jgi:hypothetical protein